ncbi:MAG: monomethylamine:corrinoid methyltransferase [Candidatus Bathyarchaeia archaeon]
MISLLDVAERAQNGQKMGEMEWNMGLFRKMQELTKRHNLRRAIPEKFYEVDEAYLDALFDAAVDFLSEMGVYCISTSRVIQFTEDEIREAARQTPSRLQIGEGKDSCIVQKRAIGDRHPVHVNTGGHSAWSEEILPLPLVVRELTRIPRVGSIEGFNFVNIDGREVHGTPKVVYASLRAVERVREGIRLAGKPGLAICYYPILTSAAALIAPIDPERGLRRGDGVLLSVLPDLKVESDLIAAAIVYEAHGCYRVNGGAGGLVGGFCGDIYGAMIESVARNLAAWLVYRDQIQYSGGVSTEISTRSLEGRKIVVTEEEEEAVSKSMIVQLSIRRNTNIITYGGGWPQFGGEDLCSEEHLIETALACIRSTVMGHNIHLGETPPPTTVSWGVDVSDATVKSGLGLPDLYELTCRVRKKTLVGKTRVVNRDRRQLLYYNPKTFLASELECYDYIKQRPTEKFLRCRKSVVKYLRDEGLPLE